jgi:hypothetical protein
MSFYDTISFLRDNNLREEVVAFCNAIADRMIAALSIELKRDNVSVNRRYLSNLRYVTSYGGCHRSGKMYVSIVLITPMHALRNNHLIDYLEYAHIKSDKDIGDLKAVSWKKYCAALMAHELAHAFQYKYRSTVSNAFGARYSNTAYYSHDGFTHGNEWQSIYRFLRVNFVNNDSFESIKIPTKRKKTHEVIGSVTVLEESSIRVGANKSLPLSEGKTLQLVRDFKEVSDEYGYVSVMFANKLCRIYGSRDMFEIHMDRE